MASSPTLPAGQQSSQQQQPHPGNAPFTNTIKLYSDGSVRSQRWAGCGVAYEGLTPGQWQGRAIALPDNRHIQSAELWGFHEALEVAEELLSHCQDRRAVSFITVKTDCEEVEKAYGVGSFFNSRQSTGRSWGEVSDRIDAKIASFKNENILVTAEWVKGESELPGYEVFKALTILIGHNNNPGNEKADQMAKYGSYLARSAGSGGVIYRYNPSEPELRAANL